MTATLCSALVLVLAGSATVDGGQRARHVRGMDENGDGRITRTEWRGNDASFRRHDRDSNGILEGEELERRFEPQDAPGQDRPQNTRAERRDRKPDAPEQPDEFREWTEERFRSMDDDRDGQLSWEEWQEDRGVFTRVDADRDGYLSRSEFLGLTGSEPAVPAHGNEAWQAGYTRGIAEGHRAGREDRELRDEWDLEGQRELETADSGYEPNVGRRQDYQTGYREGFRAGYREGFNEGEPSSQ